MLPVQLKKAPELDKWKRAGKYDIYVDPMTDDGIKPLLRDYAKVKADKKPSELKVRVDEYKHITKPNEYPAKYVTIFEVDTKEGKVEEKSGPTKTANGKTIPASLGPKGTERIKALRELLITSGQAPKPTDAGSRSTRVPLPPNTGKSTTRRQNGLNASGGPGGAGSGLTSVTVSGSTKRTNRPNLRTGSGSAGKSVSVQNYLKTLQSRSGARAGSSSSSTGSNQGSNGGNTPVLGPSPASSASSSPKSTKGGKQRTRRNKNRRNKTNRN